ncbi:hypothetical protein ABZ215_38615 [Amycolatopsis sp. NPDC006131]|uniref:hypothetical protein n=1 Tax=Amycolatopsis sp. NPDC006131 TaxID=3156731 RepID=UPI0033B63A07
MTVWIRLKRDENGDPVPALRIDGDQDREVTLHAADSAQLITNLRLAWSAAGEIKHAREEQHRAQQPKGRGTRR